MLKTTNLFAGLSSTGKVLITAVRHSLFYSGDFKKLKREVRSQFSCSLLELPGSNKKLSVIYFIPWVAMFLAVLPELFPATFQRP